MTDKNKILRIATLFIISTAILMMLSYHANTTGKKNAIEMPDAYMEDVTAVILDKVGKVTMKIVTPKMVHYAKDDHTNFTNPQLTLFHKSPNPWFVESKTAFANHGIERVIFKGDVNIHHPADFNNPATVIKTNSLIVHPNNKTAETSDPVTMIQPGSIMKAVGMQADMESGNIKLLSQAQGEYVPDP